MEPLVIFADVVCPFAYVGVRRLLEERERRGASAVPPVRLRAWPLEWVNGSPLTADATDERVEALRAQVAPELFEGFDPSNFPSSSLPAFALTSRAYGISPEVGESVGIAVRIAVFEHGLDVSSPEVIASIAADHGVSAEALDERQVTAEYEDGQRRGVQGSPHMFHGDDGEFCPLLHIEKDDEGFRITENRAHLAELFDD